MKARGTRLKHYVSILESRSNLNFACAFNFCVEIILNDYIQTHLAKVTETGESHISRR